MYYNTNTRSVNLIAEIRRKKRRKVCDSLAISILFDEPIMDVHSFVRSTFSSLVNVILARAY